MIKNILIVLFVLGGGYQAYNQFFSSTTPLYNEPYVVVYGRDSCGFTQKMISDLTKANIPFEYKVVDDKDVSTSLHNRMEQSGLSIRRYNLPVIDVNNSLSVRPDSTLIIESYKN